MIIVLNSEVPRLPFSLVTSGPSICRDGDENERMNLSSFLLCTSV